MRSIPLSKGKHALVDDEDFERLNKYKWWVGTNHKGFFAQSRIKRKIIKMHTFIMNTPIGMEIDHINRDPLDNRRENLRIVTHAQNTRNRGVQKNNLLGVRGVTKTANGKYQARIKTKGKQYYFGVYDTLREAALVAHLARVRIFNEYTSDFSSLTR